MFLHNRRKANCSFSPHSTFRLSLNPSLFPVIPHVSGGSRTSTFTYYCTVVQYLERAINNLYVSHSVILGDGNRKKYMDVYVRERRFDLEGQKEATYVHVLILGFILPYRNIDANGTPILFLFLNDIIR